MSQFKMKSEPKKPTRQINKVTIYLDTYEATSVQSLIDEAAKAGVTPDNVFLSHETDYDSCNLELFYNVQESDERYQARLDKYQESLDEYHHWIEENKEAIAFYLEKKKELEERQKMKALEEKKKALARNTVALQKEIERLEKELAESK